MTAEAAAHLTRRPRTGDDFELGREVHHLAFRDVVERQFGGWDLPQQDQFFEGEWEKLPVEILLWDGEPCGYAAIELTDEHVHVAILAIHPDYQGRGIGTALLDEAIELGRTRDVPVHIGGLHQNRALDLYRRRGFVEVGRNETHTMLVLEPTRD